MTPDEHRAEADRLAAEVGAMRVDTNPVLMNSLSNLTLTHALLATPPSGPQVRQQTGPVMTVVILLVLAAVILGSVWIIAG